MATVGLALLVVLLVLLGLLVGAARFHSLDTVVVRTAWVPVAALAAQWVFRERLMSAMSYAVVILPIVTLAVSLLISVVGLTIILSGHIARERARAVSAATALAFAPLLLAVVLIFVESMKRAL